LPIFQGRKGGHFKIFRSSLSERLLYICTVEIFSLCQASQKFVNRGTHGCKETDHTTARESADLSTSFISTTVPVYVIEFFSLCLDISFTSTYSTCSVEITELHF
jgi:hypothetical protein